MAIRIAPNNSSRSNEGRPAGSASALGTVGPEQFEAFFDKYRMRLSLEYGEARARSAVAATSIVRELATYCRTTIQC